MSKTYPYLLWHLSIKRPNQVWSIDILYLMYPEKVAEVKSLTKEYIENYNYHGGHQSYNFKIPGEIYLETLQMQPKSRKEFRTKNF